MRLFSSLHGMLRVVLGEPVPIHRLNEQYPDLRVELQAPANSISAYDSVVGWHECGKGPANRWPRRPLGSMIGWKYFAGDSYRSFTVHGPEFEQFVTCHGTEHWQCDIQTVKGLSASKSELTDFQSLDAMVETNSRAMIDAITEEKLQANLAHNEIRILRPESVSDHFARHLWDGGRIFLMNHGGSHHFAAARYIAARLERLVPLSGSLYTYGINPAALNALQRDFDMFVISHKPAPANAFHDAMTKYRATYLSQYLPVRMNSAPQSSSRGRNRGRQRSLWSCVRMVSSTLANTLASWWPSRQTISRKRQAQLLSMICLNMRQ